MAIRNTKDMNGAQIDSSACLMESQHLGTSGQEYNPASWCNDTGLDKGNRLASGSIILVVSSLVQNSSIASFTGIGALRTDCTGSKMSRLTKTMHHSQVDMQQQLVSGAQLLHHNCSVIGLYFNGNCKTTVRQFANQLQLIFPLLQ